MISYISGRLSYIDAEENTAVVETGGVGFSVFMSGRDLELLPAVDSEVIIYTHMQVREDAIELYGFLTREDRKIFRLLLGVNGIGPKAALGVLSSLSADELRFAVLSDDVKTIAKAPGIGNKTAQKLILELKDKFSLQDITGTPADNGSTYASASPELTGARNDAVEALTALGYSAAESLRAVRQVEAGEDMSTEDILRAALKYIGF